MIGSSRVDAPKISVELQQNYGHTHISTRAARAHCHCLTAGTPLINTREALLVMHHLQLNLHHPHWQAHWSASRAAREQSSQGAKQHEWTSLLPKSQTSSRAPPAELWPLTVKMHSRQRAKQQEWFSLVSNSRARADKPWPQQNRTATPHLHSVLEQLLNSCPWASLSRHCSCMDSVHYLVALTMQRATPWQSSSHQSFSYHPS